MKQANLLVLLMLDGDPSHSARKTADALQQAGIETVL